MSDRPKWVRAVTSFVGDDVIDDKYEYPMDGSDDELSDQIEAAVHAVVCGHYGHDIEDDMCMKPEHRYCIWCGRRETDIAATPYPQGSTDD